MAKMGIAFIENTLKKIFSGEGSARADENSPRSKQLNEQWEKATGQKKKPEEKKKKKKAAKKKKKKWYSLG